MCYAKVADSMPTASFITLGCKVNQAESEALAQLLTQEGYQIVREKEDPEVIIINTCTVTGTGSSKSRKLIRKIAKEHPLSTVVVMGCYSQTKPEEVAELEGVDLIVGTQDRRKIAEYLKNINRSVKEAGPPQRKPVSAVRQFEEHTAYEELPLIENESRARAMLKIQDGCSQFCTYCIIPYARGPSRSRDPDNILAEAGKLLAAGYKEIVLTGVHIGAYGQDLGRENLDLAELIKRLISLPGMTRLRLGSIEPMEFTPQLLEVVTGSDVICPHFHIPLQSGSNTILARMQRPYSTEDYARLLAEIRERLPEAALATDILTGFPGETEEEHQEALSFTAGCNFAGIHVFPYSRREGTPAAAMPAQVPKSVKDSRVRDYLKIGKESRTDYIRQFLGRELEVLLETVRPDGSALGHTGNYLELKLPPDLNPGNWQAGDLVKCTLREEYCS
jgi:threonylcarbamoyladenosine tRNA methylthiotransferase MtaB